MLGGPVIAAAVTPAWLRRSLWHGPPPPATVLRCPTHPPSYLLTLATRGSMGLLHGFVAHLLLVLASEACQAPFRWGLQAGGLVGAD